MSVRYPDMHVHITRDDLVGHGLNSDLIEQVGSSLRQGGVAVSSPLV